MNTNATSTPLNAATSHACPNAPLFDMHCHLNRIENAVEVARKLDRRGVSALCTTVTPDDALAAQRLFAAAPNVRVAAGLHPWWVISDACGSDVRNANYARENDVERAASLAAESTYVGEIGLDFSPAHETHREAQLRAFERIVRTCAENPCANRVVSIHAVRAATEALDILERYQLSSQAACIFHWFSGTSDELTRARRASCYFSINERMLARKRGREYARQIPLDRLLLETDAPPEFDMPYSAAELEASLTRTLTELAAVRNTNADALASAIANTSARLLH